MVILIRMCTVAPRIFISENSSEKYFFDVKNMTLFVFSALSIILHPAHNHVQGACKAIGSVHMKLSGNWCKVKTHSQNFMLARCENSLSEVDHPLVTPYWAELWLLLLALHQHLELTQVVLLTLDKSHTSLHFCPEND